MANGVFVHQNVKVKIYSLFDALFCSIVTYLFFQVKLLVVSQTFTKKNKALSDNCFHFQWKNVKLLKLLQVADIEPQMEYTKFLKKGLHMPLLILCGKSLTMIVIFLTLELHGWLGWKILFQHLTPIFMEVHIYYLMSKVSIRPKFRSVFSSDGFEVEFSELCRARL